MFARRHMALGLCALFFLCSASARQISGSEILENVERNLAGVRDFVVNLEIDVNMDRLRMPRMKAAMYFKQPDKFHFDASDFAMIPREGIFLNARFLRDRYDIVLSGQETVAGKSIYKLQLAAKEISARIRQMHVFVDASNWTIARMEMAPVPGRVATFEFTYSHQQEAHWLPAQLVASFSTVERDSTVALPELAQEMTPRYNEMRRALRSGSITVAYTNYRINTNLPDDLFSRPEKE